MSDEDIDAFVERAKQARRDLEDGVERGAFDVLEQIFPYLDELEAARATIQELTAMLDAATQPTSTEPRQPENEFERAARIHRAKRKPREPAA